MTPFPYSLLMKQITCWLLLTVSAVQTTNLIRRQQVKCIYLRAHYRRIRTHYSRQWWPDKAQRETLQNQTHGRWRLLYHHAQDIQLITGSRRLLYRFVIVTQKIAVKKFAILCILPLYHNHSSGESYTNAFYQVNLELTGWVCDHWSTTVADYSHFYTTYDLSAIRFNQNQKYLILLKIE